MSNPKPTDSEQLRQHNEYDSLLTAALMREHSEDWSMETVREAALICSNTMLHLMAQRDQQRLSAVLIHAKHMDNFIENVEAVDVRDITAALGPDNSKTKE